MKDENLETMMGFLGRVGLSHDTGKLSEGTRLPGLRISGGKLTIDPDRLEWPGDILYGAGLLAVIPPSGRMALSCDGQPGADVELPAMAWAYAAARHLRIDPAIVFHEGGYQAGGRDIVNQFQGPNPFGVPLLVWLGLCEPGSFPEMVSWMREIEDPSEKSH